MNTLFSAPRFNRMLVGGIVLLMLLCCAALGLLLIQQPDSQRQWRIGIAQWPGYDPLLIAERNNLFESSGLNIRLVPINSLTDLRVSFENGLIDGYMTTLHDVAESMLTTHVPQRVVMAFDYSYGADMLLATPSITTLAELKGKRIGVEITSGLQKYMLGRILEEAGLQSKDIQIIAFNQSTLVDQMLHGLVDATLAYEPYAGQIRNKRDVNVLFNSRMIPEEIIDVLAVTPAMLEAVPDLSIKIQETWQQALNYMAARPDETDAYLAGHYGISQQEYHIQREGVRLLDNRTIQKLVRTGILHQLFQKTLTIQSPTAVIPEDLISTTLFIWAPR